MGMFRFAPMLHPNWRRSTGRGERGAADGAERGEGGQHLVALRAAELLLRLTCEIERLQIGALLYCEIEQGLLIRWRRRIVLRIVDERVRYGMIEAEHLVECGHGGVCVVLRVELQ